MLLFKCSQANKPMKNTFLFLISASLWGASAFASASSALAEEACVRSENGRVVCGTIVDEAAGEGTSDTEPQVIQHSSGINFTLEGCFTTASSLDCSIEMYNSSDFDQVVRLFPTSPYYVLTDSEGNQYRADMWRFSNGQRMATIPPATPMKAQVSFVPSNGLSDRVSSLLFTFQDGEWGGSDTTPNEEIIFRNFGIN
jgi:hypothetical protein